MAGGREVTSPVFQSSPGKFRRPAIIRKPKIEIIPSRRINVRDPAAIPSGLFLE
jgi:hypothetical protein